LAIEGIDSAINRAKAYVRAGADAIFAEAVTDLDQYKRFTSELSVPVLANLTEFGMTPLFTIEQLKSVNVGMALYPLSAFRAMNKAASEVFQAIKGLGTQKSMLERMQTREELYKSINYHQYEQALDKFQSENRES
jgi:methylisocitrate lyase